ncbi:hypothetical protein EDD21DRAFT_5042 [Dissophora ornata]|nr:hypothetical protein EDD21DRAFT_5042 [Dissophora ornata]
MDGLQEQHEKILDDEDQDSSYTNSEASSSVFYSPMNSNNPTREASMQSDYHSPQEERTDDERALSAENHERLEAAQSTRAGRSLGVLALPEDDVELSSSLDITQQSGQRLRKRMRTSSELRPRPRKRRPRLLREMERIESSTNPNNPFQDTTDSELDGIESELELEREYLEQKKKALEPNLKMPQDGDVCYHCGVLTPYEQRRTTPYPAIYQCTICRQSQPSASPQELQRHEEELRELEGNVLLNNNGWFAEKPKPYEGKMLSVTQKEYIENAKATQILPPEQEILWERNVEGLAEDPIAWKMRGLSRKEQFAKYWSRGRSLVAGGMEWTMEESDLFYQGLRRFGKHNVWAIQEHIKSRSLAEVVAMIQTMETEVERRKFFCLDMVRLSKMPMAEEADEKQIEVEERCATMLIDKEMRETWQEYTTTPRETRPEIVKKTAVFNLRALNDLSRRIYIQNEGAGMDRDLAVEMYDALKKWLTPVVKELAMLHHERHRVKLVLNKVRETRLQLTSRQLLRWTFCGP